MKSLICIFAGLAALGIGYGVSALPRSADAPPIALAYQMTPGQPQRYLLKAEINASVPIFGSSTPTNLDAGIELMYVARPKTQLADGISDIDLDVEKASLTIGEPGSKPEHRLPFPLEMDQIRDVLNQQLTITRLGQVTKVRGGAELPFGVSIPGVDPKRLYALLFPVVFKAQPVKPGDKWTFTSELLAGKGAKPNFTATVLPSGEGATTVNIRETFDLKVDQSVDAKGKPITTREPAHRRTQGKIQGVGALTFDPAIGLFTRSVVDIKANIADTLVGKPLTKDEPKQILSKVDAKVTVELQPEKKTESTATN